jgi:hypothetical protein
MLEIVTDHNIAHMGDIMMIYVLLRKKQSSIYVRERYLVWQVISGLARLLIADKPSKVVYSVIREIGSCLIGLY